VNGKNGENGVHKLLVSYRSGDMHVPKLDNAEALKAEIEYFVRCLEKNEEPFNNGEAGLQVVELLEAADKSIKAGQKVNL
jgi:predicted dehydrogenase